MRFAADHGLAPLATVRSWASVGVDPYETRHGADHGHSQGARRVPGSAWRTSTLWEINEAFAVVPVAACKVLDIDPTLVNISGSGCSLGHPIAATGARMVTTLIYDLQRRGGGIGVASMCAGGGMGSALVIEVAPG